MLRLYLYARVHFCLRKSHAGPRVQRAPGLPCALPFRGRTTDDAKLGRKMSRERETISTSLRAQRRNPPLRLPCYGLRRGACHRARIRATRWLAMTWRGRSGLDVPSARERRRLARHTVCIIQSSVATRLSSKDAINRTSRCAYLELKSRRQIRQNYFC